MCVLALSRLERYFRTVDIVYNDGQWNGGIRPLYPVVALLNMELHMYFKYFLLFLHRTLQKWLIFLLSPYNRNYHDILDVYFKYVRYPIVFKISFVC